jgi:transcriptional regulator with AAA-type ATPase domain
MAEVEKDSSVEHDTRQEEQKIIQLDITNIFQKLDFLKKKVSKLERQLMETRDLCKENQRNVRRHPIHAVVQPLPEL